MAGAVLRSRELGLLSLTRSIRGFAAGALSVVLADALARTGYGPLAIGVPLGGAIGAAAVWAILVPGGYSGLSRRALFLLGAGAVALGGLLLWAALASPIAVVAALLLGGIVAGSSDVSPLGALEQGALAASVGSIARTGAFAAYNLGVQPGGVPRHRGGSHRRGRAERGLLRAPGPSGSAPR